MVCNGKQSGYAPISAEMSPQLGHNEPHHLPQSISRPYIQARVGAQSNGYQPIKGTVIPNGKNTGTAKNNELSNNRKKEYKEWYV